MNRPGKIVGVGRNYVAHAKELGNEVPSNPLLFLKPPTAVIADGDTIILPPDSKQVEYEAEIGLLIGKRLRNVSEKEAIEGIAGITCVNDVTARDLQKADGQWTRAKSFDTFCPVGPRVVPLPVKFGDIEVMSRVNGKERQHAKASDMVFNIPYLVAYISRIMTLEPGDLIATGTPDGIGKLASGDTVEIEVSGVGILKNAVK